ncbi:MAG: hypothetical protein JWN60_3277, partial [Acidobacteria bacterium]|nr:hypothetical protein [Acidobacteriota bacterium]
MNRAACSRRRDKKALTRRASEKSEFLLFDTICQSFQHQTASCDIKKPHLELRESKLFARVRRTLRAVRTPGKSSRS